MGLITMAGIEMLNVLSSLFGNLDFAVDFIMGNATDGIVKRVRDFISPIFLFIISAMALTFLFKRQFQQFGIFLLIAVAVSIIFYFPEIVVNFSKSFGEKEKDSITW